MENIMVSLPNNIIIIALLFLFVPRYASKELIEPLMTNDKSFISLSKRLGNSNYNTDEANLVSTGSKQTYALDIKPKKLEACGQNLRNGVIIKATESIKAGAVYINSVKDISTNNFCIELCCQNISCDVSVYQDKGERFCYLFKCEGKCIFKEHEGYFVNDITHKKPEQTEEELYNLNSDPQEKSHKDTLGQMSDKKEPEKNIDNQDPLKNADDTLLKAASLPPPEPVIAPHSVGLKAYCTQSLQCEDPNAACISHNCLCKNGYYIKDGLCRQVCPTNSFECYELGTLSRGPECVLKEQVCDSFMHCADGSDEFNCEKIVTNIETNDLSKQNGQITSSNQAQVSFLKSSVEKLPEKPKLTQQLPPPAKDQTIQNKVNSGRPDQSNHQANPMVKQNLPDTNDMIENVDTNRQQPPNTNQDNNPSSSDNLLTNLISNPHNNTPTNSENNNYKQDHYNVDPPAQEQPILPLRPIIPDSEPSLNIVHKNRSSNLINQNMASSFEEEPVKLKSSVVQNSQYLSPSEDSLSLASNTLNHDQPNAGRHHSGNQLDGSLHGAVENSVADDPGNEYNKQKMKGYRAKNIPVVLSQPAVSATRVDSNMNSNKVKTTIHLNGDKTYPSSRQSSSKSIASDPGYNSQKWIDSNLFLPYGISETSNQRQHQPSSSGQYFDTSQYYPPYSSDSLDALPNSLLSNWGSPDDFGSSYLDRDKPLSSSYQSGGAGQNVGYLGVPDTPYGSQYSGSNRYDYNGEYRSPTFRDSEYYPAIGRQQQSRPSAGLYEDFPSGQRIPQPDRVDKTGVKDIHTLPRNYLSQEKQETKSLPAQAKQLEKSTQGPVNVVKTSSSAPVTKPAIQHLVSTTVKPQHPHGRDHVFMSSEKVIITSASSSSAEGPIIALSLGLAFTIILLGLVGCRLRRMRHRLKKGRALHHNEADYLINGMYL